MFNSIVSAFLMYSRIPMPKVEWKEENRRYSLAFFPLIGIFIGIAETVWRIVCSRLSFGNIVFSAVFTVIPVLITGGIHLDGFCDVSDAHASYGDKQKKLEIMKDSHIGAFALIRLAVYLIVYTAFVSEISTVRETIVISCGFVLSRSLSGISAVTFKSAKSTGSLQDFVKPAHRKITVGILSFWIFISVVLAVWIGRISGTVLILSNVAMFFYYRSYSYKNFGGVTGDLSGWFLQMCEILTVISTVTAEKLTGGI